jgi:hypothetical protein
VFLKIRSETAQAPAVMEAVTLHVPVRLVLGHPAVIHVVESGDEHSAVAPQIAVNINRAIAWVVQQAQHMVGFAPKKLM